MRWHKIHFRTWRWRHCEDGAIIGGREGCHATTSVVGNAGLHASFTSYHIYALHIFLSSPKLSILVLVEYSSAIYYRDPFLSSFMLTDSQRALRNFEHHRERSYGNMDFFPGFLHPAVMYEWTWVSWISRSKACEKNSNTVINKWSNKCHLNLAMGYPSASTEKKCEGSRDRFSLKFVITSCSPPRRSWDNISAIGCAYCHGRCKFRSFLAIDP